VPGDTTRPITDRVKEALINILVPDLQGASFLDLFAGTGSVGIEVLSNGAGYVRFIDNSWAAVETVRTNLAHTKLEENADVLHRNAFAFLEGKPDRTFDYVYIAPPQYKGLWKQALTTLDAKTAWLVENAWVIVQIDPKEYEALSLQNLEEVDQRRYGSTLLVFYERSETDAQT
jgi:16S rRNA (guanine(966)-N(2))-methyltransferase RsmD